MIGHKPVTQSRPSRSCRLGAVAVALAAAGVFVSTQPLTAAGDGPPAASKPTVLFDGKSLDGWARTDFSGAGSVKVDDGAIVLGEGDPMTGITCTRKDLPTTNYELSYEARRVSGSDFFAAATFPVGKSFVTLVNGGWGGSVTGLSSINGADASENETSQGYTYKLNTWYRFRARVTDEVIRCWIDDKQIVDVAHKDREIRTRIEVRANQPLGFATWATSGAVRKIELRRLTPAEVAATKKPVD
jgi:Domain of Unknown Function (DUF1080)